MESLNPQFALIFTVVGLLGVVAGVALQQRIPERVVSLLFAALLHASWNFLVKSSEDPYHGMCAVVMGRVPYGLVVLIVSPSLTASSYSYVVIGALLHVGYQLFLQHSYRFGDLSQVREVERMREDLFQAIAHELRTPLATILMYARLLREGKARDEQKAARFLGVIERESDRLQKTCHPRIR